eukprot:evm.model.scf_477.7 EVM.evm.TU.scf_477.7   scf_477:70344-72876(+)
MEQISELNDARAAGTKLANASGSLWAKHRGVRGPKRLVPRKVPLRVEPKTHFSNERTFMAWVQMAVTLAGLSSALLSLQYTVTQSSGPQQQLVESVINTRTVDIVTMAMVPLALFMIIYATYMFWKRREDMLNCQIGYFDEKVFPLAAGALITLCLGAVFVLSVVDIFRLEH